MRIIVYKVYGGLYWRHFVHANYYRAEGQKKEPLSKHLSSLCDEALL